MKIKKLFRSKSNAGSAVLLETLFSIGVVLTFVSLFFYTFNDVYDVYDRPDIDLDAKAEILLETIMSSSNDFLNLSDLSILNLGNDPTTVYGIAYYNPDTGEIDQIGEQYSFSDKKIGIVNR